MPYTIPSLSVEALFSIGGKKIIATDMYDDSRVLLAGLHVDFGTIVIT